MTFGLAPLKQEGSSLLYDDSEIGRAAFIAQQKRRASARKGWITRRKNAEKAPCR